MIVNNVNTVLQENLTWRDMKMYIKMFQYCYHAPTVTNTLHLGEDGARALNIQHGSGVVREQGNQAFNEVVDIAHRWKNACETLQEKQLVKDNAINIRDVHLQNQNIKLQEEFVKNNNLHGD